MILATPLLCGEHSQETVVGSINKTSHNDLVVWQEEHTKDSMRKQKKNFFTKQIFTECVQDSMIDKAA